MLKKRKPTSAGTRHQVDVDRSELHRGGPEKSLLASGHIKRQGRLWIRIFPDVPVSKKPAEVRQGKGKGSVEYWAARVKPGRILFELDGVPGPIAAVAFSRAAMKLPIKTKVVARLGDTSHLGAEG